MGRKPQVLGVTALASVSSLLRRLVRVVSCSTHPAWQRLFSSTATVRSSF